MTPTFLGQIKDGKLLLDKGQQFNAHLASLSGKRVEVTVDKLKHPRTNSQNRWYWGCILKLISDYTGEEPENLHNALKAHFAPKNIVGSIVVPRSSRTLDTIEFAEYCEKVRRWAAEELNINIPDPNEVAL
jgi:hypothetical protein